MKKTANSNMYEEATDFVWRTFDAHLSGRRAGLWCVVSEKPLGDVARGAILSSAAALGFGEDACTFVALAPNDDPAEASAPTSHMDGNDLFTLLEGVDPLRVVATDTAAAQALAAAYGQPAVPGEHGRLFGRDIVAFHRFEDLLDDATHKQKAWALLKKLPRLDQN